jgi:malate dehydrogenase (oxaloacetate-decarboxylating)
VPPLSASISASLRLRLRLRDRPGAFAELARAIAETGGALDAVDLVRVEGRTKVRDVTVLAGDAVARAAEEGGVARRRREPAP